MGAGDTNGWDFTDVRGFETPPAAKPVRNDDAETRGANGQRLRAPEVQDDRADGELAPEPPYQNPEPDADAGRHEDEAPDAQRQPVVRSEAGGDAEAANTATTKKLGVIALRGDNGHETRSAVTLWESHPDPNPPAEVRGLLAAARSRFGEAIMVNTQTDGATAFLVTQSSQIDRRGGDAREVVPTKLDYVRDHRDALERMIIHRPPGAFERRVEAAETTGRADAFEARLEDYARAGLSRGTIGHDGKEIPGFWKHIHWTDEELKALADGGESRRACRRNNDVDVGKVRLAFGSNFNTGEVNQMATGGGQQIQVGAGTWVNTARLHIRAMDSQYRAAQLGHREGMGSPAGSPYTRARLEHLVALELPHVVGTVGDGDNAKDPDKLKLQGLKKVIDREWAEAKHRVLRGDQGGYTSGRARLTDIPEHLQDLEALKIALEVRWTSGDAEKASVRRRGILEFEKTRAKLLADAEGRRNPTGHIVGNQGPYTQEAFDLDLLEAHFGYWNNLQGPDGIDRSEDTLARAAKKILGKMDGRDRAAAILEGTYDGRGGLFGPGVAEFLDADQLQELLANSRREMANALSTKGYVPDQMHRAHLDLLGRYQAVEQDLDGSYQGERRNAEARLAVEQLAKDRPPQGRRLIYIGAIKKQDGRTGLLEVLSLLGGHDQYLDTAGRITPQYSTFLSALRDQAQKLKIPTVVGKPLKRIVEGRQWENAHFIGRLPAGFTADHVLGPIMEGGLGTVEVETNAVDDAGHLDPDSLIRQIMRAIEPDPEAYDMNPHNFPFAHQFRVSVIPTRVLRVLRHPENGELSYTLDHDDPRLASHEEHTLALFRNNPDGSPSALYEHLRRKVAQHAPLNA